MFCFLKKLLGVKKGTDTRCVLRETGQMPIFFYWFRCIIRFWNSFSLQTTLFLRKLCGLIYFLQTKVIHGLTRFCMRSKIYLHLNSFWMPYDLVRQGSSAVLASLCHASMLAALVSTTATMCVSPPFFVCLASPSILLVFFCVFCPALPQLCTLPYLGFFFFLVSFLWFWVSLSSFLLLSPLLEPSLLFIFVVCQVPAGGRSCNTTPKKKKQVA